jgi:hypothetical protein
MMRCRSPLVLLLLAGALPGAATETRAQVVAVSGVTRDDSVRAHRSARARQAAFERTRRANLPSTWGGGSGRCDERIGRFCLTYSDDDGPEWEPPEEPEATVRARDRLLAELASVAALIPGDDWVAGQRVRYLVEAGEFDEARAAAGRCHADRWWCEALAGYAAHYAGIPAAADAAYERALQAMPAELHREWTDLRFILDGAALRHYRQLDEPERSAWQQRFWKLTDPLPAAPGNDVRSEHLSRNVAARMQEESETTEDISWGEDLREILIRFGRPSGHETVRTMYPPSLGASPSLISHFPEGEADLLPPPSLLTDSFAPAAGIWDDDRRRPRASYVIPRAGERLRWIVPFEHQLVVFRDGDSATVVAAYQLPADSVPGDARVEATLSAWSDLDAPTAPARLVNAGLRAVLAVSAPPAPVLISLEAVAEGERRAARARVGRDLRPLVPGVLAASDLLLFDPPADSLPETREAAMERARGSDRVRPGERIGVYWELYGLLPGRVEALAVSLRLVDADPGWLRRLAERVGAVREEQPIRLVWGEEAAARRMLRRSLAIEVPADLRPGSYALEVTIAGTGREPLVTRRVLRVEP